MAGGSSRASAIQISKFEIRSPKQHQGGSPRGWYTSIYATISAISKIISSRIWAVVVRGPQGQRISIQTVQQAQLISDTTYHQQQTTDKHCFQSSPRWRARQASSQIRFEFKGYQNSKFKKHIGRPSPPLTQGQVEGAAVDGDGVPGANFLVDLYRLPRAHVLRYGRGCVCGSGTGCRGSAWHRAIADSTKPPGWGSKMRGPHRPLPLLSLPFLPDTAGPSDLPIMSHVLSMPHVKCFPCKVTCDLSIM